MGLDRLRIKTIDIWLKPENREVLRKTDPEECSLEEIKALKMFREIRKRSRKNQGESTHNRL